MQFIKCDIWQLELISEMYGRTVKFLEETVNYPKWSSSYPCRDTVKLAIQKNEQYACIDNGKLLGAVVLNENPNGNYSVGNWRKNLKQNEYLVIHTLAVDPNNSCKGIGGYIIDCCIEIAKQKGYKAIRIDVVPE